MKILTFLNEKGGVGKSTLAGCAAIGLAMKGVNTLVIDASEQGNLTTWLRTEKTGSLFDTFIRNKEWNKTIKPIPKEVCGDVTLKGHCYIMPGSNETRFIKNEDEMRGRIPERLFELADKGVFDVVVVDNDPTITKLHEGFALVSDSVLIPTDCEAFSIMEGLPNSIFHMENSRKVAREAGLSGANISGIIPNKYRSSTNLHNKFIEALNEKYGDLVWEPIPLATAVPESQLMRQFIFAFAPDLKISQALDRFVTRIIQLLKEDAA